MNRKIVAIVILFGIFGLIYGSILAVNEPKTQSVTSLSPLPTYIPATTPQSSLWFQQNAQKIDASGKVPVDVYINTKENKVTAIKLSIQYDPKILRVESVKNVGLLSGKEVVEKKVDTAAGMISLEVQHSPEKDALPIQGADRIAEVVFVPIDRTVTSSRIKIHPSTVIEAEGVVKSAVVKMQESTIQLKK